MIKTTAIILAAGNGARMNSETTKQRMLIGGESVLHRSVRAFSDSSLVDGIIVVCREDEMDFAAEELLVDFPKIEKIVVGGNTRAESAKNAFSTISREAEFVAIHDAARCLITVDMIDKVIMRAYDTGAATAGYPVTDTVKIVSNSKITKTVDRSTLFFATTPQVFKSSIYSKALSENFDLSLITDDNMLIEQIGISPSAVDVGKENIKITTPQDKEYAEFLIKKRERDMTDIRVGHGYDVHRFSEGRDLILGGVRIPYERGLLGHSDADVHTHAIMDSLLGAASLGDIGRHFPDTSDEFCGISSLILLEKVVKLLNDSGYTIKNIDATLVLQRPKIAPYIDEMRANISEKAGISLGRVNIKATTEEHLGFTGSGDGAAAHAVSLIEKK